jgi:hypothetical protein
MSIRIRRAAALSITTLALLLAPVAFDVTSTGGGAAWAKDNGNSNGGGGDNGNSNGGGGDNGNSNGGGHGGGGSGGGGDTASTSDSSGGSNGHGFGRSKKTSDDSDVATLDGDDEPSSGKTRSLNAEFAGLNSLKRNINGLMNSSDPRMEEIREFVLASADFEVAKEELAGAENALNEAKLAYLALVSDLGVGDYDDVSPSGLQGRIDEIDGLLDELDLSEEELAALTDEERADLEEQIGDLEDERATLAGAVETLSDSEELATLLERQGEFDELEDKVTELGDASGDEALRAALETAANDNREVTDEVFDWADARLDDLVDDYLASQ